MKRYQKYLIFSTLFWLAVYAGLIFSFPSELVKGKILAQLNQSQDYGFSINSLKITMRLGVKCEGVKLLFKNSGTSDETRLSLFLDELYVSVRFWPLLFGEVKLFVSSELYGGEIEVDYLLHKEKPSFSAHITSIQLEKAQFLKQWTVVPLHGIVDGEISLNLDPKSVRNTSGNVQLQITQASTAGAEIFGFTLPPLSLGDINWKIPLQEGKIAFDKLSVKSKDLEMLLDGNVQMREKFVTWTTRSNVQFKFSDEFLKKNGKIQAAIDLAGMREARNEQGFYEYMIQGRLASPRFHPGRKMKRNRPMIRKEERIEERKEEETPEP